MFIFATDSALPRIRRNALGLLLGCAGPALAAPPGAANWFPEAPTFREYAWHYEPCADCEMLAPRPLWTRMARLAGLPDTQFQLTRDDRNGPAYAAPPNVVVLSPAALDLDFCQQAFLVGHEIVHLARRHFDEDAIALSVLSGKAAHWTHEGADAMQLVDGDFGLALRTAHLWQQQEHEADWLGALLAAHAGGCSIEAGALPFLRSELDAGGGLAAAHAPSAERARRLLPFGESARRLTAHAAD